MKPRRKYPCYSAREEMAHHEAAHAVFAARFVMDIESVSIKSTATGIAGKCVTKNFPSTGEPDYEYISMLLAGPLAAMRYNPNREFQDAYRLEIKSDTVHTADGSDFYQAWDILKQHGFADREIVDKLEYLERETKCLLDKVWPQVVNLAKLIAARGKLTDEIEILDAMEGAAS
jgi:hypothetical protein